MDMKRLAWAADIVEIQQLAYRYAICADSKDADGMAALYAQGATRDGQPISRDQLRARFACNFAKSPMGILNVGNHLIDIDPDDPDRATGTVYCRGEIEDGDRWLIQQIVYHDKYVRQDGRWRFQERKHLLFYGSDLRVPPIGLSPSDAAELTDGKGSMPQYWESYRNFWREFPDRKHY
jgi:hypothetical protein